MLKKVIIMVMGMICGVGLLLGWQEYQKKNEKPVPVTSASQATSPEKQKKQEDVIKVDFDAAFESARRGEYWMDEQEKSLKQSTEDGVKKLKSQGDDAANTFKKYLTPE